MISKLLVVTYPELCEYGHQLFWFSSLVGSANRFLNVKAPTANMKSTATYNADDSSAKIQKLQANSSNDMFNHQLPWGMMTLLQVFICC